jgi:hypothetical protein
MKTLTPKLQTKGKPQEADASRFTHIFAVMVNLITLIITIGIIYILLFPVEYKNKDNTGYSLAQLRQLNEINKSLEDVKTQLTALKNLDKEGEMKDVNWQKMSKDYHLQLLITLIKNKIVAGDDFKSELEELNKFGIIQKDINFQVLKGYASADLVQVKALIANLYDEATTHSKAVDSGGFIDSVKHFFMNLFTVKKLDEHKMHATSNEIISIVVQLLLDGKLEAAYTVANKFHGVHDSIAKIADTLKPANDALNAADKLEVYG